MTLTGFLDVDIRSIISRAKMFQSSVHKSGNFSTQRTTTMPPQVTVTGLNCTPIQALIPDILDEEWIQWIFGVLYFIVFVVGCFGNFMVIYAISCRGVQFNVRAVFIWSLTIADLLVCFLALPLTAFHTFTRSWPFGSLTCQAVPLFMASSVFINSFTLMTIAWDRYLLLVYPRSREMSYKIAIGMVCCVWAFGIIASSPYAAFMELRDNLHYEGHVLCDSFCEEGWPSATGRKAYGSVVVVVQFVLPLVFCTWAYASISRHLQRNFKKRIASHTQSIRLKRNLQRRRRRVNLMILYMLISFIGVWLPMNVLNALRDFSLMPFGDHWFSVLFAMAHLVAMTTVIWNPIIYSFCNECFRAVIKPKNRCNPAKTEWPLSQAETQPKWILGMFEPDGTFMRTVNSIALYVRRHGSLRPTSPRIIITAADASLYEDRRRWSEALNVSEVTTTQYNGSSRRFTNFDSADEFLEELFL